MLSNSLDGTGSLFASRGILLVGELLLQSLDSSKNEILMLAIQSLIISARACDLPVNG